MIEYTVMIPMWHCYVIKALCKEDAWEIAMKRSEPDWIEGMENTESEVNEDAQKEVADR